MVDVAGMVSQWDERVESWVPICPDCFPERESLTYRFATEGLDDETFIASDFDVMVVFDDDKVISLVLHPGGEVCPPRAAEPVDLAWSILP